jgi:hypothetical protein
MLPPETMRVRNAIVRAAGMVHDAGLLGIDDQVARDAGR